MLQNMKKNQMDVSGWHLIDGQWKKIVSRKDVWSTKMFDKILAWLVEVDLNGGWKFAANLYKDTEHELMFNLEFYVFGSENNMKYSIRKFITNPKSYDDLTFYDKDFAQIILVDLNFSGSRYAYFSMTPPPFYRDVDQRFLEETFGMTCLGGMFYKIGTFSSLDEKLRDILD